MTSKNSILNRAKFAQNVQINLNLLPVIVARLVDSIDGKNTNAEDFLEMISALFSLLEPSFIEQTDRISRMLEDLEQLSKQGAGNE